MHFPMLRSSEANACARRVRVVFGYMYWNWDEESESKFYVHIDDCLASRSAAAADSHRLFLPISHRALKRTLFQCVQPLGRKLFMKILNECCTTWKY